MGARQGAAQEGFLSRHTHRLPVQDRDQRHHQAREEAGFSGVEFLQVQASGFRANTFYFKSLSVNVYFCAQGPGHGQGALVISAGGIASQAGNALRQGCGNDGPLGKTLGRGHRKPGHLHKAEVAVEGPGHCGGFPLARGGGLLFAHAGVGERSALLQGFHPGFAPGLSHGKGHQAAGSGAGVERLDDFIIGLGGGCGHYFYHFATEAEGPFQDGLKHRKRRRFREIVVGADEHGAAGTAGLADAATHGGGRLHLQVHVLGAGPDGFLQDFRGLGFFAQAAGGDERHVRVFEQLLHLVIVQGATVQADFRHLHRLQQFQDFRQFLILQANTDHQWPRLR